MVKRVDLHEAPEQKLAKLLKAERDAAAAQATGPTGVKHLGDNGDIIWSAPEKIPDPDNPDGPPTDGPNYVTWSVKDVPQIQETLRHELELAEQRIADARQELDDMQGDIAAVVLDIEAIDGVLPGISQAAADAQQAANNAANTAGDALLSANGQNSIIIAVRAPTSGDTTNPRTGLLVRDGDVWIQWDDVDDRNVEGSWRRYAGEWVAELLGNEVLASLDVNKLVVIGSARMTEAVVGKIIGDAAFFNKLTVEDLVSTGTGTLNAVVVQRLAAQTVASGEFRTAVDPSTGLYAIMDSYGFRVIDNDGVNNNGVPETIVRLGPDGQMLLQLGSGQNSASIDGGGNVSAMTGSFADLWVGGNRMHPGALLGPRGVVSWGEIAAGRYSRTLQARDQVLGLEGTLQGGRVYRLRTNGWTCGAGNNNSVPSLWLHYTLDGSYPGANWVGTRKAESANGQFGGQWKTHAPLETYIDLRGYPSTQEVILRAGVTLADAANLSACQVSALFGPALIWCEDLGVEFANRGGPYYDTGGMPIRTRTVQRWEATSWATYITGGARDLNAPGPSQGTLGGVNRSGFYTFPSLTAALAGATIHRITIRAFADWWWGNLGIGAWCWHGHIGGWPGTMPAVNFMRDLDNWPRGTPRDINIIPSEFAAWQNGTRKGIAFSTPNPSQGFIGTMSTNLGATYLEIDYEK